MTRWGDVLDAFQAHLAAQHRALEDGRPEAVRAFVPATDLGPLPPHLAGRARAVATAAEALTAQLVVAADAAARQLRLVSVLRGSPEQPASSFVDTRT